MPRPLTADDLLPMIAKLSTEERRRLLHHLVPRPAKGTDAEMIGAQPARSEELTNDCDALAWDAGGWENFG